MCSYMRSAGLFALNQRVDGREVRSLSSREHATTAFKVGFQTTSMCRNYQLQHVKVYSYMRGCTFEEIFWTFHSVIILSAQFSWIV